MTGRGIMKIKKRWFAAGVAAVSLALGGGIAYAAWSASGAGSGAARALTAQGLTINAVAPGGTGASLYPGGPAGWVYFSITNPNPYSISITHLSWGTPVSADTANCPSSNISLDAGAPTSVSLPVPANGTSGAFQVFGVLDMSHSAPDGCQGVVFNVPVTVTGTQN
jgi:hypothetical protein